MHGVQIKRTTQSNRPHWALQTHDLATLVRWIDANPRQWNERGSHSIGRDRSWDLGVGYEGALRLARDGWHEGVLKLGALVQSVPNAVEYFKELSVAGELPDVPRALAGDPFNMVTRGKRRKPKPSMTIVVQQGFSSYVSAQEVWNFGAALVAIVDKLESRNVRCEVLTTWTGEARSRIAITTTLKRTEDALDLSALAFGLAHPAMSRRLCFAAAERAPRELENSGYGRPSPVQPYDLIDLPEGALIIDGVGQDRGSCSTVEGALPFVATKLEKAAGERIVELWEDA